MTLNQNQVRIGLLIIAGIVGSVNLIQSVETQWLENLGYFVLGAYTPVAVALVGDAHRGR
ncbi:hypothetical protein [Halorussus aquaticus]|uniref:hypothetical protein n=1 Tax=Halorussus aquaticus TaxID=2953748 RepID=UPI0036201EE3